MSEELKPCPFCGGEADFPNAASSFGTFYECGCGDCGIPTISIKIIDCFDRPRDHVHNSWNPNTSQYAHMYIRVARDEAVEQWNTRTNQLEQKGGK